MSTPSSVRSAAATTVATPATPPPDRNDVDRIDKFLFDIGDSTLKGEMIILYRDFYNQVIKHLFENQKLDKDKKIEYFKDALHAYTNYRRITDNAIPFDKNECYVCLMDCYKDEKPKQIPILMYNGSLKQLYDADNKGAGTKMKEISQADVGGNEVNISDYTLIGIKKSSGGMKGGGDYLTVRKILENLEDITPVNDNEGVAISYIRYNKAGSDTKKVNLKYSDFEEKLKDNNDKNEISVIILAADKSTDKEINYDKSITKGDVYREQTTERSNTPNFKRLYLTLLYKMIGKELIGKEYQIDVQTPIDEALKSFLSKELNQGVENEEVKKKVVKILPYFIIARF